MEFKRLNQGQLIFLLFLLISSVFCQDLNSTSIVSTDIKNPILKQYNAKKFALLGQLNVPVQIQQPLQIQPVYYHQYLVNNTNPFSCWFQSSTIKRNKAQYLSFNTEQLGKFDDWNVQILDATYLYESQTVVGLFTNGSLFFAKLSSNLSLKGQVQIQKIYNYVSSQTDQIWELSQYSLYSSNTSLYLLKEQTLYKVTLNEDALAWNILNYQDGLFVKKVINLNDVLYVLKFNQLNRIQSDSIDSNILIYQSSALQFIDMAVFGQSIYILDRFAGIIVATKDGSQFKVNKIYPLDRMENAMRINVYDNTILVTYLIHHKNFIAQIFITADNNLALNKFYYRYQRLSNILMYNKYAIGYSLNQMIVFQHSINRNTPISIKSSQFLSKTLYNKIVDIIRLGNNTLDFILILDKKIYVQTLGQFLISSDSQRLLHKTLKCTFQKVGNYTIDTIFKGVCKNSSYSSKDTYCKQMVTYQVQVHSQKIKNKQEQENTHLALIFMWCVLLVLLIGVILVYRKRILERAEKLLQEQRRRANSQMISMQKDNKSEEQVS